MTKNYVITSATDGIGRSIVEKILKENADNDVKIIVNYGHSEEKAKAFMDANKEYEEKIILIKADMSDYDSMCEFAAKVCEIFPKIDHVVCNTGISAYGSFDDYTWEMWNKVIQTNLSIPAFLIQKLKYHMNPGGSIVMMGSDAGIRTYSSSVVYSVSKAGIIHLAKVLVKEFESLGVRVNAIAPGFIQTSWQKNRSEESYERINRKIAVHRFGTSEEVADMAYSVLQNTYMNGSVIEIDGGYDYF